MNKIKIKLLQIFILIIYLILGFSITKDYGISYDELEYRQQGFIVLNHIGEKIYPGGLNNKIQIYIGLLLIVINILIYGLIYKNFKRE